MEVEAGSGRALDRDLCQHVDGCHFEMVEPRPRGREAARRSPYRLRVHHGEFRDPCLVEVYDAECVWSGDDEFFAAMVDETPGASVADPFPHSDLH